MILDVPKRYVYRYTLVKPDRPFVVDYQASVGAYYVVNQAAVKEKLASSENIRSSVYFADKKNNYPNNEQQL